MIWRPNSGVCMTERIDCGSVITMIVLGGTNVLGGRSSYFGAVAGLQPQLLFADLGFRMPAEVFRQIVFGVVIIAMFLLYGRERLQR
jgi:ribose transport system permease protein